MAHLEQVVSRDNASRTSMSIEEGMSKRNEDLLELTREFDKYKARFYEIITAPMTPSFSSFDIESDQVSTADVTPFQSVVRTVTEEGKQLDYIHGTVTNLREIGYEINDEINVHSRLLEDIENRENEIFQKAKTNDQRLREYIAEKSSSLFCLWTIVIVLFVVFILVLMH